MNFIHLGTSGSGRNNDLGLWSDLRLPDSLRIAAEILTSNRNPTPLQRHAIEQGLIVNRRNVLVSAPTNSGKTLVGYLILLEALARGKRAVLLEPLRALAREKADELERHARAIGQAIGRPFKVRVSTGDYRLENETFSDPAPGAELIIATPERLESILRSPENLPWFADLGAVCVDEAHMIGDLRRGPTLEYLITSLLTLAAPPRMALLSATINGTDRVADWLRPCDVISITERTPPLEKLLVDLNRDDDPMLCVAKWLSQELAVPGNQALVFIHQARQTAGTAARLTEALNGLAGTAGALPYNSQMSSLQREMVRQQFVDGESRIVVTTSALAMGVNLPATHVVVRDLTYIGTRSPGVAEILQMMGRAGRGDSSGKALVVKRASDDWVTSDLVTALRSEAIPELKSALVSNDHAQSGSLPMAIEPVASLLLRGGEIGKESLEVEAFFDRSLGGKEISAQVPNALRWLRNESLGFQDTESGKERLTVLGEAAVRAVLPLPIAAGIGHLFRDLLALDDDNEYFGRWSPLDSLITLELLHGETPSLRRYSADLHELVMGWLESHSSLVPVLYRHWLRGDKGHSKAAEVLGSLAINPKGKPTDLDEWARQQGILATFKAIVIYERALGRPVSDIARQFRLDAFDGIEERWRDTMLWLLGGLSHVLDVRSFYFHLCGECGASPERVKVVKGHLGTMCHQTYDLIERIKFASPLGGLILTMRRRKGKAGVGLESIRKLENAGITQISEVAKLTELQLKEYGLRRDVVMRLRNHFGAASG
jgi:helicase